MYNVIITYLSHFVPSLFIQLYKKISEQLKTYPIGLGWIHLLNEMFII